MKRWIAFGMVGALCSCATSRSTFDFVLSGDSGEHVHSGARVTGAVSNAGFIALDDPDMGWSLAMSLGGLAPGDHILGNKTGQVVITRKVGTPAIFTTALGGSCTVTVAPHNASNGDVVRANFFCTGLASAGGQHVNVPQGEFKSFINDESNNLNLNPPGP